MARATAPTDHSVPLTADGSNAVETWFASRGWEPWPFQRETWSAYRAGRSGLVHVPTGAGKTYAAYGGPLRDLIEEAFGRDCEPREVKGLRIVFITPLRAVTRDIELALKAPLEELGLLGPFVTVESRTGDTTQAVRARQKKRLPNVLITTPESLTLRLTEADAAKRLASVRCAIVDEWHELLSSKRGTQVELALARLRRFASEMRTWALSATLGNLEAAADAAVPDGDPLVVRADIPRPVVIESVLPDAESPFPWAGHMGLTQLTRVVDRIEKDAEGMPARSTLIFVNTRSQCERWHSALHVARPDWERVLAIHHGSLDREDRERVEAGLKSGAIKVVVATSSLDLGVDFAPVETVMQIGSPKGIARLMQRAGRASHRPGAACTIVCVPTNAMEFLEVAAVRRAVAVGRTEPRLPEERPLDVLVQHMVTIALGGGFEPDALFDEVRRARAYRDLPREEFDWALALVTHGGETLRAYSEYHRVQEDDEGVHRVENRRIASIHRMNIGAITADAVMDIRFRNGKKLGYIEESFIDKLKSGQKFVFAGRVVRYEFTHDLTAYVTPATGRVTFTPVWGGTRLPISESLSEAVRAALESVDNGEFDPELEPELAVAGRLVKIQRRFSVVPRADQTLVELCRTREGSHMFVYPFEGQLVHGGLAALVALRLTRRRSASFSIAANDYGFELLSPDPYPFDELIGAELFSTDNLGEDARESVNLSAMARSQFREVARVSGLVIQNQPGMKQRQRHMQARAGLIYDVFEEFDPENKLLHQAKREVLEKQFERSRLGRTLSRIAGNEILVQPIERMTPLSLPLFIERVGARLTTESIAERVEKMRAAWEKAM